MLGWVLSMFSIAEKFFQARNSKLHKCFLIACIGVSLLNIVSIDCFAAVVTPPVQKEKVALPPRQVVSKLADSSQVLAKPGQEKVGAVFSGVGPNGCQLRFEGGIESGASCGVTGFKPVAPCNVPDKTSQKNKADGVVWAGKESINHYRSLLVLVGRQTPMYRSRIVLHIYFSMVGNLLPTIWVYDFGFPLFIPCAPPSSTGRSGNSDEYV
jgi:hypothetical protein